MHTSHGRIVYDPNRHGMKNKTQWWAVVNIDREITRYYRWWVQKEFHIELADPSWDAHISIIRGERPPSDKMHLWKKYHGEHIEFKYGHNVRQGRRDEGLYWHVDVESPQLIAIRDEFGFPSDWKLHITIGRTWHSIGYRPQHRARR